MQGTEKGRKGDSKMRGLPSQRKLFREHFLLFFPLQIERVRGEGGGGVRSLRALREKLIKVCAHIKEL